MLHRLFATAAHDCIIRWWHDSEEPHNSLFGQPRTHAEQLPGRMIRQGVRRFSTTLCRAAQTAAQVEAANQYGVGISKAQGYTNGLVGGMVPQLNPPLPFPFN